MAKGDAEGRERSIGAPHARYPHEEKEGAETKEGGNAMKANESSLLDFLRGPKQFEVPIYQRMYSWTTAQCDRLWNDLVDVAQDRDGGGGHFVGSIVYIESGLFQVTTIPKLLLIDGQQRLCQGRSESVPVGRSKTVPLSAAM